jgi:hypothetical protein
VRPHTESQLKPGLFFSPGFYMGYWRNCIEANFTSDIVWSHGKLQKHREMYTGAIMAAAQTKATKIPHFVGLPDDEPSDVDIVKLTEITMPSGRKGTVIERLNVQLTECNYGRNESILEQLKKKNKSTYQDIIVAIQVINRIEDSDFAGDFASIQTLDKVYPSEVLTVELVDIANNVRQPVGSFGLTRIYPKEGASLINRDDQEAFFFEPAVFTKSNKAVSIEWEDKGSFTLLTPQL